MRADERMMHGLRITVLLVEQEVGLPAAAVLERAVFAFEASLEVLRKLGVGCVPAREERVPARAGNCKCIELCRLVRNFLVRAVGVKALGAATIDLLVEG